MLLAVTEALGATWGLPRFLLAMALLAFGLFCCYVKYIHIKYDYIPGPPRASFFLGHIPILWRILKKNEIFHEYFLQWAEEYGPIVRLNIAHRIFICVLSPEGVKEFLTSPQYPKDQHVYGAVANMFGIRVVGNGLASDCNINRWRKQRKIMDPAFSRTYLNGLEGIFNDQAEEFMKVMEEKADGETEVDMTTLMERATIDIIGKVAFGMEMNTIWDKQMPFLRAMTVVMRGIGASRDLFFQYNPRNRKVVEETRKSARLLRRIGKECIEERLRAVRNGEETPSDILAKILENAGQEGQNDEENMLDNFMTFFIAGYDTTANLLSTTLMELGRHPEILAKLQAEVDEVIGVKRDITCEDLRKLHYLSQVFKETLRLYPPVPSTIRWTGTETIIEGIRIPANSTLIFSTGAMGRMEKFFKNPLMFDPDRFREDQPKPYFCYFPFSLGPRSCIGQTFAQEETKLLMAKFLQKFEFQLVPPQSFKLRDTGIVRLLDNVVCKVTLRNSCI
uniref:cholesterol 24-hydroxylase-like n=1 Tax=Euleptes europaea TaxID=460621 RepID=UPI00253F7D70|nr:cholesterol 24-hydroxylase-like [Euleptes europaea]